MNTPAALELWKDDQTSNMEFENTKNCTEDVISQENTSRRIQMVEKSNDKTTTEFNENIEEYQQWEISTEVQLKRMETNLKEARMTIETQRNNIIDLQIQNENLSQKLNKGRTAQEAIFQKVEEIWEFYNFVELYTAKLDERIKTCERSGEEVKQFHKMKSQEIETLIVGFKELQVKHEVKCKEKEQLQLTTEYHEQNLLLENKIKEVELQLLDKDTAIQNMVCELKLLQEKFTVVEDEKERLKNTAETDKNAFEKLEDNLREKLTIINELETMIGQKNLLIQKNNDELNNVILAKQNVDNKIEELEKSLNRTIQDSQEELAKTNADLTEKMSRIESLVKQQQKLENENNDLKLQKDSLVMKNANISKQLKETQDSYDAANKACEDTKSLLRAAEIQNEELKNSCLEMNQFKDDLKTKEEIISQLNDKNEKIQHELQALLQSQQYLQNNVEALKSKIAETTEEFNNLKNKHENVQKSYEAEKLGNQALIGEIKIIQESSAALQVQLTSCQNQLTFQENELRELRMKNIQGDSQLNSMQEHVKLCEAEIQNWKSKAEEFDKINLSTLQDNQAKLSMIDKLKSKLHVAIVVQKRAKAMKCEIIEKMHYIIELEKQVNILNTNQNEYATEKLSLCKKVSSLMEEVQNLNNKIKQLSEGDNNKISHLETTLNERNKRIFEMENEAKTQKESFEKLQVEHQKLAEKCETRQAEFFSTLSSFKMSNQRIVSDKEKEIASFKVQLENAKTQVENMTSQKEETDKMNADLQSQITALTNELNNKKKYNVGLTRNRTAADIVINPACSPKHTSENQAFSVNTPKSNSLQKQITTPIENRKHVTFSKLPSSCDSESSTSDCMEIASIIPAQKVKGKAASPYAISFRPSTPSSQTKRLSLGRTSPYPKINLNAVLSEPKPIPRGLPAEFTPNAKKLKKDYKMPATPTKGIAKVLKATQGDRKTFWGERKKKNEENLKWFDLDAAFDFNSENEFNLKCDKN